MLLRHCSPILLAIISTTATHVEADQLHQRTVPNKFGCAAVNLLVTAFLPKPHATAFCSAYLQIPKSTWTSTATETAKASTATVTSSGIVPVSTVIASQTTTSVTTTTIDLWTGTPACSTLPPFEWLFNRSRQTSEGSLDWMGQACRCLEIPMSTSTVVVVRTETPTITTTAGVTGLAEFTSTKTETAIETRTKYIFLIDQSGNEAKDEVHRDRVLHLPAKASSTGLLEALAPPTYARGLRAVLDSFQPHSLLKAAS